MFHLRRNRIRHLRAVIRQTLGAASRREVWVRFQATVNELVVRACSKEAAVEYRGEGEYQAADFFVRLESLAACEGKSHDAVCFEPNQDGSVTLHWEDRGIPQQVSCEKRPPKLPEFPAQPTETVVNEPGMLQALADACETTDPNRARYALGCLCLRGASGSIATTDGRQLLIQNGYQFPWSDDVLVPANKIFASRELQPEVPVTLGKAGDWVSFGVGLWTVWIAVQKEGRFPKVDEHIRPENSARSQLTVDPLDATFAVESLKRLPAGQETDQHVTLDLNGEVLIRARASSTAPATELFLARSSLHGDSVRAVASGDQLGRALRMGLTSIQFFGAGSPIQASDARRHFISMPFSDEGAVPGGPTTRRINSLDAKSFASRPQAAPEPAAAVPTSQPIPPEPEMQKPRSPEKRVTPIEQAIAVRTAVREALTQTNELIRALKRQKRQSRLVESTLQSLKQLQSVA